MTGKDILDRIALIIKRQDLDRVLLLSFVNATQRYLINNYNIPKLYSYNQNVDCLDGVIDITGYTSIHNVYWQLGGKNCPLTNTSSIDKVIDIINSMGSPRMYLIMGTNMNIIPVPAEGTINIYGEKYPVEMADNISSTNLFSIEVPEVLIYYGASEYFDMLGEADKGQLWRAKGVEILTKYIRKSNWNLTNNIDMLTRDPYGNMSPYSLDNNDIVVDEYDGGGLNGNNH